GLGRGSVNRVNPLTCMLTCLPCKPYFLRCAVGGPSRGCPPRCFSAAGRTRGIHQAAREAMTCGSMSALAPEATLNCFRSHPQLCAKTGLMQCIKEIGTDGPVGPGE